MTLNMVDMAVGGRRAADPLGVSVLALPSLGFTGSGPKKRKYPLERKNVLLKSGVRGQTWKTGRGS